MEAVDSENPLIRQITCGSLLEQLQQIWDEVGESDDQRDKMLIQLEQECLDVYKRKVDFAVKSRAHLLQELADARVELTNLLSALGEKTYVGIPEKTSGTIKEQLAAIAPALEKLCRQKDERIKEFFDVQAQIQKICAEIAGASDQVESPAVDESDLSLKKLDEFQAQLQELQKEKSDRLHKVLEFVSTVHDLCAVLGTDFLTTVTEVHSSLDDSTGMQSKSISDETLSRLANTVIALKEDKKQRLHKLQELATQLIDLWNLMDTPPEERSLFDHVTCNISASVDEVTVPGSLASDLIEQAEVEVERLDQLKASRMKEIAFKRQSELEEILAPEIAPLVTSFISMETRLVLLLFVVGSCCCCNARELIANHVAGTSESLTVLQPRDELFTVEALHVREVSKNDKLCMLCEEFATDSLKYLSENKTQTEIIDILHKSCSKMQLYKQQCITLVDYYAPLFFSEVALIQAEDFCRKVGICIDGISVSQHISKDKCDICHNVITEALLKLEDPDTELEVIKILLKACQSAGQNAKKCKKLVFEYAPIILINAEQFLKTNDVCTILHACPSAPAVAKIVWQASAKFAASS